MDKLTYAYYEVVFERDYLKKKGNEFQDFFSEIMEKCHPNDFQRVRPWGNVGDKKNDGYLRSERTLFQVYAPNDMEAKEAIAKIQEDFCGALDHWSDYLDKWVFVHNSRNGLGPDILKKILDLDISHRSVNVCSWGFEELKQHAFNTLREVDLASFLGFAPSNKDMFSVRYENVQEVLNHIAGLGPLQTQDLSPVPPDKLQRNHLSGAVKILLTSGMYAVHRVGDFFDSHPNPRYGDEVALAFNKEYKKWKTLSIEPNIIFFKLQEFTGGNNLEPPNYQAAVLAVLAYFFEQCDIFDRSSEEVVV